MDLNKFKNFFENLNKATANTQDRIDLNSLQENEILNRNFDTTEIKKGIKSLKRNKAAGIDSIINELIIEAANKLTPLFVNLFNVILKRGVVPSDWAKGIIIPIFKNKGDPEDPDNYRGISLLSCAAKLFTTVLNNRLNEFLSDFSTIGEEQAGFRKNYSCSDHIFTLQCLIDIYTNHLNKNLYCCFIDYRKAFDTINRAALWQKLASLNINGKILNVIKCMYENAKSCIRINNETSDFFACKAGVRQGDNLSPLLFSLYLNDLQNFLSKAYNGLDNLGKLAYDILETDDTVTYLKLLILLYADDTIIFAESIHELQAALNGLSHYCKIWGLEVNVEKTKVLIFSKRKQQNHLNNLQFNGKKVEIVQEYKYLGITFNYNGNFKGCLNYLTNQGRKAMFSILAKARKLQLDIDVQLELFDKTVIPVITYGCEIWGYCPVDIIETLHLQFCKILLKVNRATSTCMVLGELGRLPIRHEIYKRMLLFWSRCSAEINKNKISSTLYSIVFALHNDSSNSYVNKWLSKIYDILEMCNMTNYWYDKNLNNNVFKTMCKSALATAFKQKWLNDCQAGGKCNFYKEFKTNLFLEKYLLELPDQLRIPLCKFRVSAHLLPIEKGRHQGVPRNERLCNFCADDIGDEYHYLMICPQFKKN